MYGLLTYSYTPGNDDNFPTQWPEDVQLEFNRNTYTLLMAVHPKCNCSSASLSELSKLTSRFPKKLQANILFVTSKNAGLDWVRSKNWQTAEMIPGAQVIQDINGRISRSFNLQTSGATLLYNQQGNLVFSGGITSARGHEGDNAGSQAISEIVSGNTSPINRTGIFGCHLFSNK